MGAADQESARPAARLAKLLYERVAEHYLPTARPVSIGVRVADAPELDCRFVLGERLTMSGGVAPADAVITLTRGALAWALAEPAAFDWRNEAFLRACNGCFQVDGESRFAYYWLQLLKRPEPAARAALARARAVAPVALAAVPAIARCDRVAMLDAVRRSTPLHLQRVLDWPAVQWDPVEWDARYGDIALREAAPGDDPLRLRDVLPVPGREHDDRDGSVPPYTDGCLLPEKLAPLFALPGLPAASFSAAQLWSGRRRDGFVTGLHCDIASSFLAQVRGRKKVRLFAPGQSELLYVLDAFNSHQLCRVNADTPDLVRFPLFAQASPVDVILEPGDLLIVPTGWYHCTWALDDVLSVSRFMRDEVAQELT
ncbi:cupin-like domain-containing protein [Paraburkholderia agricolaris]|uniref:Cupin-like domain-containing protein n=1 Tax=Paraburkholderia agricolaris TaxID=2152888 RepID=A0ABW8ZTH9_9BURK